MYTLYYWCARAGRWFDEDVGPVSEAAAIAYARQVHAQRRQPVRLFDLDGRAVWSS